MPIYTDPQSFWTVAYNIFVFLLQKITGRSFNEPVLPEAYMLVRLGGTRLKFKIGDTFMIDVTLPADHQDEPFSLDPITGAFDNDTPPNPIAADQFTTTDVVSDNPDVLSIIDDPATPGGKAFHFGVPGTAHAGYDVLYQGNVVQHYEIGVTLTTGAINPDSIQGGGIVVPGLNP